MVGTKITLLERRELAEGTAAFEFEKPPDFRFAAGQSVDLTLIDPPETDAQGDTRTFSPASAPSDPRLVVASRLRDTAFKRALARLRPGAAVGLDGPFGSFTLHRSAARPAVFLAGGIGITPFMSMLTQAALERSRQSFTLFYCNRRPEDAAFLPELRTLAKPLDLRLVETMTAMSRSRRPWTGELGRIGPELVRRHLPRGRPVLYIAGPPGFVAAMKEALAAADVDEDDVRSEDFKGY